MSKVYAAVTGKIIEELTRIVGDGNVITDRSEMEPYSHDEMARDIAIVYCPDVVVKPGCTEEVSEIMRIANRVKVPVTPRGAGTGLSGGAVPVFGGILLSMERLNRILEVDEDNLMITVEAGASLMEIYEALKGTDLFFPPHPGDESAHIGGAVAANAGGARTVKYGVMRDFVKGGEVVLPTGEILKIGGNLMKNNTGYNLLHLLIGSEGTLGVFTKLVLRLLPKPKYTLILILSYEDVDDAVATVPEILRRGIIPLGIEYIEEDCIKPTEEMLGKKWPAKGKAFLMVIVVGNSEEELYSECEEIANIGERRGALDVLLADRSDIQETIMDLRSNIYEGLKPETIEILDVGVPPSSIAGFVKRVREIAAATGVSLRIYGHAGDGNVHIHVMKTGLGEDWRDKYSKVKEMIFQSGKSLGGVITAEHGVGAQKIRDLHYTLSEIEIELMKKIKEVFDPNHIMNPGKVIP
ncbi:MAG: FAD-binding oxidoreductase [Candidatus Bathyarchaeia archaeon]